MDARVRLYPPADPSQEESIDTERFDELAKELSRSRSRRSAVRTLAGAAAGGLFALLGGSGTVASGTKIPICHLTGSAANPVIYIEVDSTAVAEHTAHGDAVDLQTDAANCGACGNVCDALERCVAGSCLTCGGEGQACCADLSCESGLTCTGGTCVGECSVGSCTTDADCCAPLLCNPEFGGFCDNDPGPD